jgi:hypothetical protein
LHGDYQNPIQLSTDIPNHARWSVGFMWKLFAAWMVMGFRNPKITVKETIDA